MGSDVLRPVEEIKKHQLQPSNQNRFVTVIKTVMFHDLRGDQRNLRDWRNDWLVGFTSWQYLWSYQGELSLVAVYTHGDFIVLSHWELRC